MEIQPTLQPDEDIAPEDHIAQPISIRKLDRLETTSLSGESGG
jgi:hypothetical protein